MCQDFQSEMHISKRGTIPWQLRTRTLDVGRRTLVMGIVNVTPDSFSDGGLYFSAEKAVEHAMALLDEGANLIDLGAESTRPGSRAGEQTPTVSIDEEQARLLPVLEGILKARPEAIISIDTYKAATAQAALRAGAQIINDVSGFLWDSQMASLCAKQKCGVVLMHTRGRPGEWSTHPQLAADELIVLVREGLAASIGIADEAGIAREAIVLDPGYGFGKRFDENYALLARQRDLLALGRPLLVGLSRKSFLGRTLAPLHGGGDAPVTARDAASLAVEVAAILNGAAIVRVHAVRQAVEAARIADAVLASTP